MPRISLRRIADEISNHTLQEVRRVGGSSLWYDFQPLMDLIQKYGAQRERDGQRKGFKISADGGSHDR